MDFRKALIKALGICGERAVDPTLLYYALCDAIGNNLQLKPQAESFHHFNQSCQIVETMAKEPDPRMILTLLEKCKKQPDAPEKLCLNYVYKYVKINLINQMLYISRRNLKKERVCCGLYAK